MNKKIADYLPYYIGQDCMIGDYKGKIQSVGSEEIDFVCVVSGTNQDEESGFYGEDEENDAKAESIKPILRPLSSMTMEEMSELHVLFFEPSSREIYALKVKEIVFYKDEPRRHTKHGTGIGYTSLDENKDHIISGTMSLSRFNADQFHYLLQQGFDLFGLIEANLAVDKTKEVPHATN